MRVLVFGQSGQVACELARRMPADVTARFLSREEADLFDPKACAAEVAKAECDAVLNATAWTAVDTAEAEDAAATVVHGDTPSAMAHACAARGLPFLHISTDYVFDGTGRVPFLPDHPTAPLGAYGRTKVKGEKGVRAAGGQHLILRTSWVVSAHGKNFVKTMLRLGRECESLQVVSDQVGGPTPAANIANALISAARVMVAGHSGGTFHFSGTPDTSWADFAREIMVRADLTCRIEDIPTSAYPSPTRRLLNSKLDCTSFEKEFDIPRSDWRVGLMEILNDLGAKV
jgi:dTDP-4-dehydrorhamnose reductase